MNADRPRRSRAVKRARRQRHDPAIANPRRHGFWLPQVMRHERDGAVRYGLHEVHFVVPRTVHGYTERSLSPLFGTVAELRAWIVAALAAPGQPHDREDLALWLRHVGDRPIAYD